MDDAQRTRIERHLRAAVEAAVGSYQFDEAVRIAAEASVEVAVTLVTEGTERVEILFENPVVFDRPIAQWVPSAFVGAWEGPETDLATRAKQLLREQGAA
jgi:hypothetical protein